MTSCLALLMGAVLIVNPEPDETWRGGTTFYGGDQPYVSTPRRDLSKRSYWNMCAPLFVSTRGRYVWSERPFAFSFTNETMYIEYEAEKPIVVKAGSTLREAYLAASRRHFPPAGRMPDELFFARPQFNSWIESQLVGNGQRMIEDYVEAMMKNGFSCGVFMIDDGWAPKDRYGDLAFDRELFPEPQSLFGKLRSYGIKTILWTTPYIFDKACFRKEGEQRNLFFRHADGKIYEGSYWPTLPACGVLNLIDVNVWSPIAARYRQFMDEYGFDGYKFDFTDAECLLNKDRRDARAIPLPAGKVPADYTEAWGRFASSFTFNELRAGWKYGGLPLVCRLQDKDHSWEDLRKLVPDVLSAGMIGCAYVCPDMIGGGNAGHFRQASKDNAIDAKLFVRSAQVQALMPMMQFSAAPWRILDKEHLAYCRAAADLHVEFAPHILALARHASQTGEPIVRPMEYVFPHQGLDKCRQQFMLGDKYLVAPVVSPDDTVEIYLPTGKWRDDEGKIHSGPKVLKLTNIPLSRLPYFERR